MNIQPFITKKPLLPTALITAVYNISMVFLYFIAYTATGLTFSCGGNSSHIASFFIKLAIVSALFIAPTIIPICLSAMWYYYGSGDIKKVRALYWLPLLIIIVTYLTVYILNCSISISPPVEP